MRVSAESASTIANTLGVSRATVYRVLAEQAEEAISSAAAVRNVIHLGRSDVSQLKSAARTSASLLRCRVVEGKGRMATIESFGIAAFVVL